MTSLSHALRSRTRLPAAGAGVLLAASLTLAPASLASQDTTFVWDLSDPRPGLTPGWMDAGSAARNIERVGGLPKPAGFFTEGNPGDYRVWNSDLAFRGNDLFVGSFNGFQVFDVSDPRNPKLRVAVVCPGGQGDVSVHGNLLFMSVEQTSGRLDCGTGGVQDTVSVERFRGVRIFDISDVESPRQITTVQTCRGSHTHTLVTSPRDSRNVWIYVSGTGGVRSPSELPGCSGATPEEDPNTSLFRIEVIRVPLAAPEEARVVAEPRIFSDPQSGAIAGLWRGGDHGAGTQGTAETNQCHDITVFPEIGLAAGACSGNGILLDISDPEKPVRIAEVTDPNFAYWHSATFNNDGTKVLFTDEWGGGTAARCRATDPATWGADAIFELKNRRLTPAGYYKLPVPQGDTENCVAHNGSLIPVPGRDIMAQAWYQGGLSVFDFTDPAHPVEIAWFDRGPVSPTEIQVGGFWSTYWHNGHIYGSEMARGIDAFQLTPSEHLTADEIEAAKLARHGELNVQRQTRVTWPAAYPVARAYLDQLARTNALPPERATAVREALAAAERARESGAAGQRLTELAEQLGSDARHAAGRDAARLRALAEVLRGLESTGKIVGRAAKPIDITKTLSQNAYDECAKEMT